MYVITGVAGFIGFHTAKLLLERGHEVIGLDNLSPYYSVSLKRERLGRLKTFGNFSFHHTDIADSRAIRNAIAGSKVRRVIHLAAQAGVRHSLAEPDAYVLANLVGHFNMLEYCRLLDGLESLTYASSSSVYGANDKLPFSESDQIDRPISLYAATKRAAEAISQSYAHAHSLPSTGLRFFTVYGPWGRPDMAIWRFAEAIMAGRPIKVFNNGRMRRDFTYIDDVVAILVDIADDATPPDGRARHRVYNVGNGRSEQLLRMIEVLEQAAGRKAKLEMLPMQAGDVPESLTDIAAIRNDYGFAPATTIDTGIPRFMDWYLGWRR